MRLETTFRRPEHRLIPILLAAILALLLPAGCAGSGDRPSTAVSGFMDTVIAMDAAAGSAFLTEPMPEGDLFLSGSATRLPSADEEYEQRVREALVSFYSQITYTVKSSYVNGDTAEASVEVIAPSLITLEEDLMALVFSDAYADPAELDAAVASLLLETLQAAAEGYNGGMQYTVRLNLEKQDGEWKIQNPKELGHAVVGNIHGLILPGADTGTFG